MLLAQSGQTYDRFSLEKSLEVRPGVDPLTNSKFEGEPFIVPNYQIRTVIAEWEQAKNDKNLLGGDVLPVVKDAPVFTGAERK